MEVKFVLLMKYVSEVIIVFDLRKGLHACEKSSEMCIYD